MPRSVIVPVVLMLLQGCSSLHVMSHVPLATMSRLSAMKVADIDPVHLRVAARMPERIEPRKNGVKLTIAIGSKDAARMELVLEPAPEPPELSGLSGHQRTGTRLWNFRLSPADAARLQRTIAAAGGSGEYSVSIAAGVDACRRGPLLSQPLPTTTFLRTDAGGFLVLAEDLDLRAIASERDLASNVPACD